MLEEIRSRLLTINPYSFEELIKDAVERNGFYDVSTYASVVAMVA